MQGASRDFCFCLCKEQAGILAFIYARSKQGFLHLFMQGASRDFGICLCKEQAGILAFVYARSKQGFWHLFMQGASRDFAFVYTAVHESSIGSQGFLEVFMIQ